MPTLSYHDSSGVEKIVELGVQPVHIGRSPECEIQTQDVKVSRRHARVFFDDGYWIEDLGSSNGVYIGIEKIKKAQLNQGVIISCGSLVLQFKLDEGRPTTRERKVAPAEPAPLRSKTTPPLPPRITAMPHPPTISATARPPAIPPATRPPAVPDALRRPPSVPTVPAVPAVTAAAATAFVPSEPPVTTEAPADLDQTAPPAAPPENLAPQLEEEKALRLQAEAALKEALAQSSAAEMRITEYEAEVERGDQETAALLSKVQSLSDEIAHLRETQAASSEVANASAVSEATEAEMARLKQRIAVLETDLELGSAAQASAEEEKAQRELEQAQHSANAEKLRATELEAQQTRDQLTQLERDKLALEGRLAEFSNVFAQMQDDASRAAQEHAEQLAQAERERAALADRLNGLAELESAKQGLEEKLSLLARVEVANRALEEKVQLQSAELNELQEKASRNANQLTAQLTQLENDKRLALQASNELRQRLSAAEEHLAAAAASEAVIQLEPEAVETVSPLAQQTLDQLAQLERDKLALEGRLAEFSNVFAQMQDDASRATQEHAEQLAQAERERATLADQINGLVEIESVKQGLEKKIQLQSAELNELQEKARRNANQLATQIAQLENDKRLALQDSEELRQRLIAAEEHQAALGDAVIQLEPEVDETASPLTPKSVETVSPLTPEAGETAAALSDALGELRSSLRAALDEAVSLTEPAASVQMVNESLTAATEQIENVRDHLRALNKLLGIL